jgi:hypothetical protein
MPGMEPPFMSRTLAALLVLAVLGTACAGPSEPPPSSIRVLDSSKIAGVKANLSTDTELAGAGIQVTAENDTCVLSGSVASEEAKNRATALAKKVPGIEKVDNRLKVVPPAQ